MLSKLSHKFMKPHNKCFFGVGFKEEDLSGTVEDIHCKVDYNAINTIYGKNRIKVQEKTCTSPWLGYLTVVCNIPDFLYSKAKILSCGYLNDEKTAMDAVMYCGMDEYREFCRRCRDSFVIKSGPNKGQVRAYNGFIQTKKMRTSRGEIAVDFIAVALAFLLDSDLGKELGVVRSYALNSARAQWVLDRQRDYYDLYKPDCQDMIVKFGDPNG